MSEQPPPELPLFPLPGLVVFPGMTVPLYIFEERYRQMVKTCVETNQRRIVIVMARPPESGEAPHEPHPARVGTFVDILSVMENADGTSNILAHGQERCCVSIRRSEPVVRADGTLSYLHYTENVLEPLERADPNLERVAAWDALEVFRAYAETFFTADARQQLEEALPEDLLFQASFICANLRAPAEARQALLEAPSLSDRFAAAQRLMVGQLENPHAEEQV